MAHEELQKRIEGLQRELVRLRTVITSDIPARGEIVIVSQSEYGPFTVMVSLGDLSSEGHLRCTNQFAKRQVGGLNGSYPHWERPTHSNILTHFDPPPEEAPKPDTREEVKGDLQL